MPKRGVRNVEVPLLFGGGREGGCTIGDGMLVWGCHHRGWVRVHTRLVPMGFRSENHGFCSLSVYAVYFIKVL